MNFLELSKERYTCKKFDPEKKIPRDQIGQLKEILRLSPSSVNSQPWVFLFGHSDAHKEKIRPAVMDFNWLRTDTCSDFVIICVRKQLTEAYLSKIIDQEIKDGRLATEQIVEEISKARSHFVGLHQKAGDCLTWEEKQAYIAMTTLLYGAASMGIDSTPIEGFYADQLDKILGLDNFGIHSVLIVTLGYRAADDHNAARPKSRLEIPQICADLP